MSYKINQFNVNNVSAILDSDPVYVTNSKYLYALTDSNENVICSVNSDLQYTGLFDFINKETEDKINQSVDILSIDDSKYKFILLDSNDNVVAGITSTNLLVDCFGISDSIKLSKSLDERLTVIEENGDTPKIKKIICWGDSLTAAGVYETKLQSLLGNNFEVVNMGIGGESSLCISARAGAITSYLTNDVLLPGDKTAVQIGDINSSGIYVYDMDDTTKVEIALLRQGDRGVSTVYINDIECSLKWTGSSYNDPNGKYMLNRVTESDKDVLLKKDSIVLTNGIREYRNEYAYVLWLGTNGKYNLTSEDTVRNTLVKEYKKMIDIIGSSNYVIIGLHHYSASREKIEMMEHVFYSEFGNHFINWRKYLVERGLDDAGLISTDADLTAIQNGKCPPQLMTDGCHHTIIGYNLLGTLIYNRFKQTGIV